MSISVPAPKAATVVPDERRLEFLPALFGRSLPLIGENAVYSFMVRLSPLDYGGGFWAFYEHEGNPLFHLTPRFGARAINRVLSF